MIRNWLRNFMIGRYGIDQLYFALFVVSMVFWLAAAISKVGWLLYIGYFFIIIAFVRAVSKNISRRRAENDRFLVLWMPLKRRLKLSVEKLKSRKYYKFFKCPSCGNLLRVPRGKGKIKITCPKCGQRFEKKT